MLVVDDDPMIREILLSALELDGYDAVAAADGMAALEAVAQELPALVVLDLMMPRMDGFAFAAALEERGLREQVPLLVLTADGRAEEKAARIGAEGWLEKPFTLAELLERIAALAATR